MLRAACAAARREGWEVELLLSDDRPRPSVAATRIADDGIPVHFVPADLPARRRRRRSPRSSRRSTAPSSSTPTSRRSTSRSSGPPRGRPQTDARTGTCTATCHERARSCACATPRRFFVYGRRVQEILCVAPHLVQEVRSRLAPPGRVQHFPNAIDTRAFPLVTPQERAPRASDSASRRTRGSSCTSAGTGISRAGTSSSDAVARLRDRDNLAFLTLGGGDVAAAEIAARGLSDRVRLLDPSTTRRHLYAAADVLVSPSRDEGMPFSMIEALSRGIGVRGLGDPGPALRRSRPRRLPVHPLDAGELAAGVADAARARRGDGRADARAAHQRIAASMDIEVWAQRSDRPLSRPRRPERPARSRKSAKRPITVMSRKSRRTSHR